MMRCRVMTGLGMVAFSTVQALGLVHRAYDISLGRMYGVRRSVVVCGRYASAWEEGLSLDA